MIPQKASYADDNELIDEFCDQRKCSFCNGIDENGEPNGYGCPDLEEWIDKHAALIRCAGSGKEIESWV
jgi:hypothetical protein